MDNREFDELGDKIKDIVDRAVKSQDYQKLSQDISRTVNKAVDTGSEALKNALNSAINSADTYTKKYENKYENRTKAFEAKRKKERRQAELAREQESALPVLYGKTVGIRFKGMMQSVTGGLLASGMGLGCMVLAIFAAVGNASSIVLGGAAGMAAGTAIGAGLLVTGCRKLGQLNRFQKYQKMLGKHTYCNFRQLSAAVDKPVKFVKKDIKAMISKGWFLQGHVDSQETCLITSDETYRQYMETQKQLEMKQEADAAAKEKAAERRQSTDPAVQEVLDRGNEYLIKIRKSNDAIPGEEISAKISRMELIVEKIFERARNHPEIIPDLKRLMDYYLPMTMKLLDAYEDMDNQPVQGENIQSSKKEIEETLDTLNQAFEKLLDSVFQDTALDVSSDISVLHTLLAQEGLTEDDFAKMKEKSYGE